MQNLMTSAAAAAIHVHYGKVLTPKFDGCCILMSMRSLKAWCFDVHSKWLMVCMANIKGIHLCSRCIQTLVITCFAMLTCMMKVLASILGINEMLGNTSAHVGHHFAFGLRHLIPASACMPQTSISHIHKQVTHDTGGPITSSLCPHAMMNTTEYVQHACNQRRQFRGTSL